MSEEIQINTSGYPLVFLMVDSSDHINGKTGLTPSVKLSKAGGAGVTPAGAVSAVDATNNPGWYKVLTHPVDVNTLGPLVLSATAAGADPTDHKYLVVGYNPQNSGNLGLSSIPTAFPGTNSGIAVTNASNQVYVNPLQIMPTGRLDNSLAQCLIYAQAQGGGNWALNTGTRVMTIFANDGSTPLLALTFDSVLAPTTRTRS